MPDWICAAGSALLIPSGPSGNHFYVVLNNPSDFDGYPLQSCISCCVCTIRSGPYDETCVVEPGEHKFIIATSYVAYRYSRIDASAHLRKLVKAQTAFPQEPVGSLLLARIRDGLKASKQTPNYIKRLAKD